MPERASSNGSQPARVAVVLPGGGARGAYEAGALAVLLPALEARGERVTIYSGTSVGAPAREGWRVCVNATGPPRDP